MMIATLQSQVDVQVTTSVAAAPEPRPTKSHKRLNMVVWSVHMKMATESQRSVAMSHVPSIVWATSPSGVTVAQPVVVGASLDSMPSLYTHSMVDVNAHMWSTPNIRSAMKILVPLIARARGVHGERATRSVQTAGLEMQLAPAAAHSQSMCQLSMAARSVSGKMER